MIGRTHEISILKKAFKSSQPELIAIIGRRRVGKTFLIRNFFGASIDFEMVGLKDGNKEQQLRNFSYSLKDASGTDTALEKLPKDWLEAFYQLKDYLSKTNTGDRKKVVFIDELPWIASGKSDFLTGFSYFWNSYASNENILVVICGSATAWMIKKILNNKGGLHNRVTKKILLRAFTLSETETYFKTKGIHFDRYQILQLYMAIGGIPHYLDQVEGGKTAVQNIDEICFHPEGMLRTEYDNLYSSLFLHPERYERVVEALADKWKGLSRIEILDTTQLKDGGSVSTILRELEQSGFITSYVSYNKKKKDTLYRLTDNYSLFYLKYIKDIPKNESGNWQSLSQNQSWKSWSGYAFENICLQHIDRIKHGLGIAGVHTKQFSFFARGTDTADGTQIDLLIDRMDNAISICEMKFYNDEYDLTKVDAEKLKRKRTVFRKSSQTKKQIFLVLLTTFGLSSNKHSFGLVDNALDMDVLFS